MKLCTFIYTFQPFFLYSLPFPSPVLTPHHLLLLLPSCSLGWLDSSIFSLPLINQHQLLPGLLSG